MVGIIDEGIYTIKKNNKYLLINLVNDYVRYISYNTMISSISHIIKDKTLYATLSIVSDY